MTALDQLLGLREVLAAEGCSRSTLYVRINRGEFPAPIPNPTGGPNRWRKSKVLAHQCEKFARLDKLARAQERRLAKERS